MSFNPINNSSFIHEIPYSTPSLSLPSSFPPSFSLPKLNLRTKPATPLPQYQTVQSFLKNLKSQFIKFDLSEKEKVVLSKIIENHADLPRMHMGDHLFLFLHCECRKLGMDPSFVKTLFSYGLLVQSAPFGVKTAMIEMAQEIDQALGLKHLSEEGRIALYVLKKIYSEENLKSIVKSWISPLKLKENSPPLSTAKVERFLYLLEIRLSFYEHLENTLPFRKRVGSWIQEKQIPSSFIKHVEDSSLRAFRLLREQIQLLIKEGKGKEGMTSLSEYYQFLDPYQKRKLALETFETDVRNWQNNSFSKQRMEKKEPFSISMDLDFNDQEWALNLVRLLEETSFHLQNEICLNTSEIATESRAFMKKCISTLQSVNQFFLIAPDFDDIDLLQDLLSTNRNSLLYLQFTDLLDQMLKPTDAISRSHAIFFTIPVFPQNQTLSFLIEQAFDFRKSVLEKARTLEKKEAERMLHCYHSLLDFSACIFVFHGLIDQKNNIQNPPFSIEPLKIKARELEQPVESLLPSIVQEPPLLQVPVKEELPSAMEPTDTFASPQIPRKSIEKKESASEPKSIPIETKRVQKDSSLPPSFPLIKNRRKLLQQATQAGLTLKEGGAHTRIFDENGKQVAVVSRGKKFNLKSSTQVSSYVKKK